MPDTEIVLEGIFEARESRRSEDGRLRFVGKIVEDNTLSLNRRFYSAEFIDESVRRTMEWMGKGHTVTIYSSHGAAVGSLIGPPTGTPIGKAERVYREGREMLFPAVISPTTEGKDIMTLIEDGVMARMSLRSRVYEASPVKMTVDGEEIEVENMQWAVIEGIDFTDHPGVRGAGIVKILESAPAMEPKETEMAEITLEVLKAEHPELVEAIVSENAQAQEAAMAALRAEESAKRDELIARVEALVAESETTKQALALREKAETPLGRILFEMLKASPEADVETLRDQALTRLTGEAKTLVTSTVAKGVTAPLHSPDVGDEDYESQALPQNLKELLRLSGGNIRE